MGGIKWEGPPGWEVKGPPANVVRKGKIGRPSGWEGKGAIWAGSNGRRLPGGKGKGPRGHMGGIERSHVMGGKGAMGMGRERGP
jgi:hypothetical protein